MIALQNLLHFGLRDESSFQFVEHLKAEPDPDFFVYVNKVHHTQQEFSNVHITRFFGIIKGMQILVFLDRLDVHDGTKVRKTDSSADALGGLQFEKLHVGALDVSKIDLVVDDKGHNHLLFLLAHGDLLLPLERGQVQSLHLAGQGLFLLHYFNILVLVDLSVHVHHTRVGVQDQRSEFFHAHLSVTVKIHHRDHHVNLLVRDHLTHADQNMPNFGRADEVVVVQIDELERSGNFIVGELRWEFFLLRALLLGNRQPLRFFHRHVVWNCGNCFFRRRFLVVLAITAGHHRSRHLAQRVVKGIYFRSKLRVRDGDGSAKTEPDKHVSDFFDTAVGFLLLQRNPIFHAATAEHV
mmetsp:Transcript_24974/g.43031  ORF Transcript_24974/g.43031 Transcript_24974/m.43031 type:complete len:352 (-) Transcript_24974:2420-3475(-)